MKVQPFEIAGYILVVLVLAVVFTATGYYREEPLPFLPEREWRGVPAEDTMDVSVEEFRAQYEAGLREYAEDAVVTVEQNIPARVFSMRAYSAQYGAGCIDGTAFYNPDDTSKVVIAPIGEGAYPCD